MLSCFTWKREIADVMFAFTQRIEHLANTERNGGFELARGTPEACRPKPQGT